MDIKVKKVNHMGNGALTVFYNGLGLKAESTQENIISCNFLAYGWLDSMLGAGVGEAWDMGFFSGCGVFLSSPELYI